jgi:DNA-binding CsgD family transcriptional regulator
MPIALAEPVAPPPTVKRGAADKKPARKALNQQALHVDRARRALRRNDTERAALLWEGVVRGSLELVDWFDAGGRRFILVKLNDSGSRRACGLTAREYQVAMAATLGESSKITGYRLGISPSRVSTLLKAAMRKLGVRSKAQLVIMARLLENQQPKARVGAEQSYPLHGEGNRS